MKIVAELFIEDAWAAYVNAKLTGWRTVGATPQYYKTTAADLTAILNSAAAPEVIQVIRDDEGTTQHGLTDA